MRTRYVAFTMLILLLALPASAWRSGTYVKGYASEGYNVPCATGHAFYLFAEPFIQDGTSTFWGDITASTSDLTIDDITADVINATSIILAEALAIDIINATDVNVADDLAVTDDASIGGDLTLTGVANLNSDATVEGTLYLTTTDHTLVRSGNYIHSDAPSGHIRKVNGTAYWVWDDSSIRPYNDLTGEVGAAAKRFANIWAGKFSTRNSTSITSATGDLYIYTMGGALKFSVDSSVPITSVTGALEVSVGLDGIGAIDLDYGSADITDHTFLTDGTGDAEIVLPDDSIGSAEILDAGVGVDHLAAAVAGNGLTGGAGSALAVGGGTCITANANDVQVTNDSIDGAQLADTITLDAALAINTYDVTIGEDLDITKDCAVGTSAAVAAGAGGLQAGWHMDEASGNLDNFEGTAGYDMTTANTPTYDVAAVFDTGLTFALATTEYAEVSSDLGITGWPVTISGWFKTSTVAAQVIFALADVSAENVIYSLEIRSYGHVMGFRRNTSTIYTFGQSYICDDEWHHAVFVIASNTDSKIYVDGVLEGINTTSVTWNALIDTASIARSGDNSPSGYFDGEIDEVVIYDTALSAVDIKELYAEGNRTRIVDGRVNGMIVEASTVVGNTVVALNDMVQKYDTDETRPVPVMEDASRHPHQVIYYGTCTDGSITYTSDGFEAGFASGCTPIVVISPLNNDDTGDALTAVYPKTSTNASFTYEVRTWDGGTDIFSDTTGSITVYWVAMGWL